MKKLPLIALLLIAVAMLIIGIKAKMLPPALTGIGFIIIAILFNPKK